jgi:hypothetical protein
MCLFTWSLGKYGGRVKYSSPERRDLVLSLGTGPH